MKNRKAILALALALPAAFAARPAAAAPPAPQNERLTEAQANELQDKFDHAMGANDAQTVSALLADNVVFVHPSAAVQTKAELVAPIAAGKSHLASVVATGPRKITLFDGGALVDGPAAVSIQVPAQNGGQPTVRTNYVYVSTLWTHTAAGWQILLSHGTYLQPPGGTPAGGR
jgi:ketosteroid isomerase-like protein